MFTILRKEIVLYLSSMVAYVTIGAFLIVLGLFLWVFPDTSILEYGYASLESLFNTIPYLFMFLIPAITMRSLAEERREGTFELLATRPLTFGQIIMGKYFACVLLVLFALIPTYVYYYSVTVLGNPQNNIDTGAVIGSYIGLFLLGSAFVAIGLFASAITKNQIIAFTIAVFLSFFVYSGFDSLSQLLSLQSVGIEQLGISSHYDSVSRGVLDTRDLFYFIALSAFFILLALIALKSQMQRRLLQGDTYIYAGVVAVAIIISIVGFTRVDFTKEKRFTLSNVSRNLMDSLNTDVKITVYLQGDNLPASFKRLQRATRDMLSDMQAYSHRKLQFQFVDPLKGLNQQEQDQSIKNMVEGGIEPTNLSLKTDDGLIQKLIVPAAVVSVGENELPVNLLQRRIGLSDDEVLNNSIQNLEYAFTSVIKKAVSGGRPQIGIVQGHNELNEVQLKGAVNSLAGNFLVGFVDLSKISLADLQSKVKLLIIAKPDKPYTELEKFKIDQYIMNGGSVLWSIDQVSAELDSLRGHGGDQLAFPKQLNLDDQLFRYGVRINYDLVADISCTQIPVATGSMAGQSQIQMVPWLFNPLLMPLSKNPIVKNVDGISTQFISTIDTLAVKGVKKTILLQTSPYNNKVQAPHMLSLAALEQEPDPKAFHSDPKNVAVLLEGRFKSDFQNRPVPEGAGPVNVLQESKPAKMIVISDGDILKNQVASDGSPYPLGYDHYTNQTYGNKNLLLNMVDYLTGDTRLIALRTKEIQIRPLNRARIRNEKLFWQLVNNIIPPALVLIFAIFQHYLRRRRYAH